MRRFREIQLDAERNRVEGGLRPATVNALALELETNGLVVLPSIVTPEQLREMQTAFEARLLRMRWNNFEGYQRTELYRHMIEDVLLLAQGFVDLAVHPLVKEVLNRYLGSSYRLTEAKGWRSLTTKRDFHGWHGDMWYNKRTETTIHREIKLAMYLTDVRCGAFNFIKGTHRQQHPHNLKKEEVGALPLSELIEVKGSAGTVFMFDTSIVHRQGLPMLEPRQAIFYAYHDPGIPLQEEDITYNRYHPLYLNAAFLGNLSPDDQRILGFGDTRNFQPAFVRPDSPSLLSEAVRASLGLTLRIQEIRERIIARWQGTFDKSDRPL
jgi:Phytanoyl-CoA dioxygenase (PhyH)